MLQRLFGYQLLILLHLFQSGKIKVRKAPLHISLLLMVHKAGAGAAVHCNKWEESPNESPILGDSP